MPKDGSIALWHVLGGTKVNIVKGIAKEMTDKIF